MTTLEMTGSPAPARFIQNDEKGQKERSDPRPPPHIFSRLIFRLEKTVLCYVRNQGNPSCQLSTPCTAAILALRQQEQSTERKPRPKINQY
jgi:hypothetical protein